MSSVLNAIEEDRQILLDLFPHIEESVWATESGCPGWSVQDLVSHMACSFWLGVDPSRLPDPAGLPAERAADLYVESRRSMTVDEVVADYESVSRKGIELLAGLDGQDEVEIPLGDVGTYPASFVPNAFAFEAYIHLRFDLFGRTDRWRESHPRPTNCAWLRHSTGSKRHCRSKTPRFSAK